MSATASRRDIYYWKCDRPAAFHGTQERRAPAPELATQLREALADFFGAKVPELVPGAGQGNHLTWNARVDGVALFIRVEDGPEGDDRLALESAILDRVRAAGVPTSRVHGCDATRRRVPFAWQALEHIPHPDLNHWHKDGSLEVARVAFDIGAAVARWQQIQPAGYGPLETARPDDHGSAFHSRYADYFHLRLDEHLAFLVARGFLTAAQRSAIAAEIAAHRALLTLERGCFVHKDLALWNILVSAGHIAAFIDFDDAISGDPLDDLSLLACFHDAAFLRAAFAGYTSVRPLPADHLRRFWLHLLRNMIVKSVTRVGAGYFDRDDAFFLIPRGSSGSSLREFTLARLDLALRGLREESPLDLL